MSWSGWFNLGAPSIGFLDGPATISITVRDGGSIRRVTVPAVDPAIAAGGLPGEAEDIPLQTPFQLPAASVAVLGPVLEALRAVEGAL